jgi:hypothetical protein
MMRVGKPFRRFLPLVLAGAGCVSVAVGIAAAAGEGSEAPPSQVRRLTEAQYRRTIADVFGPDITVVGRFEPDLRVDGLLAVGASAISISPAGLEQYEDIARGVAGQVVDPAHRDRLVGCAPSAADAKGAACARDFFARVGRKLYRRPLAPAELKLFTDSALQASARLGDFHGGLSASLAGMLTSPSFLFRVDAPGRDGRQVDGYSKAVRLSYLLWNTTPDDELLAAAGRGELDTGEGLRRQVDRLMASPRFSDGVRAFFSDFLHLDEVDNLSKDTLIFPAFTSSVAVEAREQTLRTITHVLVEQDGDYRDLFTTRRMAMTRSLGPLYDIPVLRDDWYIHEFPEGDPRTGLLTQATLLAMHSHPGRTSPTLRGKAVREILLCEKVPAPPANVNFAVVQDVNNATLKTTRARLQAHLDDEECASCHKATDPIGLGLEQFDGAGQFRTIENDEPIDVTGAFEKRPFNGAAELGQLFHDSPQVSACLVRSAWRYANARDPRAEDLPAIEGLTRSFAADGHRFTRLMRTIALDPDFYALAREPRPARRTTAKLDLMSKGQGS